MMPWFSKCKICFLFTFSINKFIDQSKKRINNTVLSLAETQDLAKETAINIIKALKEQGHVFPEEEGEEEEEVHDRQEGEEEVLEDEVMMQDDEDGEEDEEIIHMYSDEDETQEASMSILNQSFK